MNILPVTIQKLHPANFAMVMATGIVSIASFQQGFRILAMALFVLNLLAYGILCVLTLWRVVCFRKDLLRDVSDHKTAPAFLTFSAGTGVLGSQVLLLTGQHHIAFYLWCITFLSWLGMTYTFLMILTVKTEKPTLEEGLNGGWLLFVVATQSISVLGGLLSSHPVPGAHLILLISFLIWLFGGMLYLWIISLIFYRYMFFQLRPGDLSPPYWINMGAMAISTLAGCILIDQAPAADFLLRMRPFLEGTTFLFWSTATWWIPMLILLGIWRHGVKRFPFEYSPLYWGAVFPLGMYTACTYRLAEVSQISEFSLLPMVTLWFALLAWGCTATGLTRTLLRGLRQVRR